MDIRKFLTIWFLNYCYKCYKMLFPLKLLSCYISSKLTMLAKLMKSVYQKTLNVPVKCEGVGLHSGKLVEMYIKPAGPNTGIFFRRLDIPDNPIINASYDCVVDTKYGTTLANADGTHVQTVEHLMAAFMGTEIDNAEVILSSCEVPVMDGSSKSFVEMINSVGKKEQIARKKSIKVLRDICVSFEDKNISISPSDTFAINYHINFSDPLIGQQTYEVVFFNGAFKEQICSARTFGFLNEVKALQKSGLALGGSLENAIVLDNGKVLNPGGLRYKNEFVRHKILDCCGDMYLAGKNLIGSIEANCAGHELNNILLRRLLGDKKNYDIVETVGQVGTLEEVKTRERVDVEKIAIA